jgi:hypothetical protein
MGTLGIFTVTKLGGDCGGLLPCIRVMTVVIGYLSKMCHSDYTVGVLFYPPN